MSNYQIDVCYVRATESNARLTERMADEWLEMAYRADHSRDRGLCLAKAAYWRSVRDAAFPDRQWNSPHHGL